MQKFLNRVVLAVSFLISSAAFAAPPPVVNINCTGDARDCVKLRRQLPKEEAIEDVLVQAREALLQLARDPRLVEVVRKATEIPADPTAKPPTDAFPGFDLKNAVSDDWDVDQVYRVAIALEDDAGNSAQLDPKDVDVAHLEIRRLEKALREEQRKLVSNDDTKLSYVKEVLRRLGTTLAVSTASPAVERAASPGKSIPKGARRGVARVTKPSKPAVASAPSDEGSPASGWAQECIARCGADTKCQLECR